MANVAFDADVLIKFSAYCLLPDVMREIVGDDTPTVLGVSQFSARARLERMPFNGDLTNVLASFDAGVAISARAEPSIEESTIAAELEFVAQRSGESLDTGESQLAAVVLARALQLFATGDKRAVVSFARLRAQYPSINSLAGKVLCLEMMLVRLLSAMEPSKVREAVCNEPQVDTAARISFACGNGQSVKADWLEGLRSYIKSLRRAAPDMLTSDDF